VALPAFQLSYRDVEELLAERGLDISYESVRSWVLKFGPMIARRLRQARPRPSDRWHLDEMVIRIAGKRMYLWRAVDHAAAARPGARRDAHPQADGRTSVGNPFPDIPRPGR
jgi:transposase-like protein